MAEGAVAERPRVAEGAAAEKGGGIVAGGKEVTREKGVARGGRAGLQRQSAMVRSREGRGVAQGGGTAAAENGEEIVRERG